MKRRLPLGTLLLLKAILVAGCGYQEEQPAPQTTEVGTASFAAAAAIDKARNLLDVRQPEEAERTPQRSLGGRPGSRPTQQFARRSPSGAQSTLQRPRPASAEQQS